MPRAVILGGTGQIGLACARRLTGEGWEVTLVSRRAAFVPEGCRHVAADARGAGRLADAMGEQTDLLLSCVAFDEADAECLARAGSAAGRIVAISSASVYCDSKGRSLDEAATLGFPDFPIPLTEGSPTVAPGPKTYSTRKRAMEHALSTRASCPVTILRPCAIHGPESAHAREWWFVKRLLDGRAAIPLAYRGQSRFQTTSTAAIADAVLQAHAGLLPEVSNVCDADCLSVAGIGRAIMEIMGVRVELVGLPDTSGYPPELGATPWSIPRPMLCAGAVASQTGYAQSVVPAIDWLVKEVDRENWRTCLIQLAAYPWEHFDYQADDRALKMVGAATLAD